MKMGNSPSTRKENDYIEALKAEVVKLENKLAILLEFKEKKINKTNEVDEFLNKEIIYTEMCLKRFKEEVIKTRMELRQYLNDMHEELDQQLML